MELKQEGTSGGLRLAGQEELQDKAVTNSPEAWDFSQEMEPIMIKTTQSTVRRQTLEERETPVSNIVIRITGCLVYLAIGAEIAGLCYVGFKEQVDLVFELKNISWLLELCAVVLLLDAVLVNFLFDRKLTLLLWAVVFPFLYPSARRSHVKGNGGIGTWASIIYFLCLCLFGAYFGKTYTRYGGILMVEDATARQIAYTMMETPYNGGDTLSDTLFDDFSIRSVAVKTGENGTVVALEGTGVIRLKEDVFEVQMAKSVPTRLVFQKTKVTKEYQLVQVILDEVELSEKGIENYWKYIED